MGAIHQLGMVKPSGAVSAGLIVPLFSGNWRSSVFAVEARDSVRGVLGGRGVTYVGLYTVH